jgi:hypothetical protein
LNAHFEHRQGAGVSLDGFDGYDACSGLKPLEARYVGEVNARNLMSETVSSHLYVHVWCQSTFFGVMSDQNPFFAHKQCIASGYIQGSDLETESTLPLIRPPLLTTGLLVWNEEIHEHHDVNRMANLFWV